MVASYRVSLAYIIIFGKQPCANPAHMIIFFESEKHDIREEILAKQKCGIFCFSGTATE